MVWITYAASSYHATHAATNYDRHYEIVNQWGKPKFGPSAQPESYHPPYNATNPTAFVDSWSIPREALLTQEPHVSHNVSAVSYN